MKLPTKLADITGNDLLALSDLVGYGPDDYSGSVPLARVLAVSKLLKGKLRWSEMTDDESEVIRWLYKNKSSVYKYLYEIPHDDVWEVIQSKVKLPKIKEMKI